MTKTILFVAEASVAIGAGHVERCLALADCLRQRGWRCSFLSSTESAVIVPGLKQFETLSPASGPGESTDFGLQELASDAWDLAVVDHYGWAAPQESRLRAHATAIMVIDDLADRDHDCDILLDQTVGRSQDVYDGLVPPSCRKLVGAEYALLRTEFSRCRKAALARRGQGRVARVLVNFGGTDPHGNTLLALRALRSTGLAPAIDVVIGAQAPRLADVDSMCNSLGWQASLHVNSREMARLMTNADLAIGAAGVSAIERCVVGLPSLIVVDAVNQSAIADALRSSRAAIVLGRGGEVGEDAMASAIIGLHHAPEHLNSMAAAAAELCDGLGTSRATECVEGFLAS